MHSPTPGRARVIRKAFGGMPEDEIAYALGVTEHVLLALYIEDINAGKVRAHFEARSILWDLIRSRKSPAAFPFFIKEQRPTKKPKEKPPAPPPKPMPILQIFNSKGAVIG